jgi:hypothetical protein
MMYRLTKHRGEVENSLSFAVCPIRDANLIESERQFDYTAMYVIVQILNCSLEKRSQYLRVLLFLWGTFLWMTLLECRGTKKCTPPQVNLILN